MNDTTNAPKRSREKRNPLKNAFSQPEQVDSVETTPPVNPPTIIEAKRGDMRPTLREENPKTRAARRAAELRNHLGTVEEGVDEFFFPQNAIPDGWSYEWKRKTVLGFEDPAYQVALAKQGWEAVPVSRHPEMMPHGYKGNFIERKGMILMERPAEITDEVKAYELKKARLQVRQKEAQLNSAEQGQFGRSKSDGTSLVKINKSYEAMPIPE
jgi:hypothetical protein